MTLRISGMSCSEIRFGNKSDRNTGLSLARSVRLGLSEVTGSSGVIDLMQQELDARISYTGPSHFYWAADGTLKLSAENEWPLEYLAGVAAGRHEPEPASVNLITSVQTENMTVSATDDWLTLYTENSSGTFHRLRFNTSASGQVALQVFYRLMGRDYLCFRAATDSANSYKNIGLTAAGKITYAGAGFSNTHVTDFGNDLYLLQTTFNCAAGVIGLLTADAPVMDDGVPRPAATAGAAGFYVGYPQIETGLFSTSPLAPGASRVAASVTVDIAAATSVNVRYSDGTTDKYATSDNALMLLPAQCNWSVRHISEIEF